MGLGDYSADRQVAIIVGNGYVKTIYVRNGKVRSAVHPSVLTSEEASVGFDGFKTSKDFVIGLEGKRYAIGESAERLGRIQVTRMDRAKFDQPFFRILFASGLAASHPEGGDVWVTITLPLGWYEKKDLVKKRLSGEWEIEIGGKTVHYIVYVRVIVEGFGVVCTQMLNDKGDMVNGKIAKMKIGVGEFGSGTSDLGYFENLQLISVRSDSLEVGASTVWRGIQHDFKGDTGRTLGLHEIDAAMRSGYIYDYGDPIPISKYSTRHIETLSTYLNGEIAQRWGEGGRQCQYIYWAGGFAPPLVPYLNYKHAAAVETPQLSDPYGAFLYGLHKKGAVK